MIIKQFIKDVLNILINANFEAFVIGGAVRDFLIDLDPTDYDIVTNAKSEEVIKLFKENNYFIKEVGRLFASLIIVKDDIEVNISTYRKDGIYLDYRHPSSVSYTSNLEEDIQRRDFTVNTLVCDINGKIIDLLNAQDDIKEKLIKTVGDPYIRFKEDALRILRALRFASKLGFNIDLNTKEAMLNNKKLLSKIAMERIKSEFIKILNGKYAYKVINEYREIFAVVIPELESVIGFYSYTNNEQKNHLVNILTGYDKENDTLLYSVEEGSLASTYFENSIQMIKLLPNDEYYRMAALLLNIDRFYYVAADNTKKNNPIFNPSFTISCQTARKILRRLRFDNYRIKRIIDLISNVNVIEILPFPYLQFKGRNKYKFTLSWLPHRKYEFVKSFSDVEELHNVVVSNSFGKLFIGVIRGIYLFNSSNHEKNFDFKYFIGFKKVFDLVELVQDQETNYRYSTILRVYEDCIKDENTVYKLSQLAVDGKDIARFNCDKKDIGKILEIILYRVMDKILLNDKTVIYKFIRRKLKCKLVK